MNTDIRQRMKDILDNHIMANHLRRTSERYAILDVICSIHGHFTIDELGELLTKRNFIVSRATLYNTVRLFIKLRMIVRHRLPGGTRYEICDINDSHCHQICTICGKVMEIKSPMLTEAVNGIKLSRFRREGFALYIYGICSSCMARNTRNKTLLKQKKSNTKK